MTKVRLRARGSDGRVAIYTGEDDEPWDAPLDNLDRTLFHSDLDYIGIRDIVTGTLSLPGHTTAGEYWTATHTLFAHGLSGQPMVLGQLVGFNDGADLPLLGSVPIQAPASGAHCRFLHLGADETNVMLLDRGFTPSAFGGTFPAIDIDWRVFVCDRLLT